MRAFAVIAFYAAALMLLRAGSMTAPETGWPVDDVQLGGCALLVLGVIAKGIGHLLLLTRPVPTRTA